MQSKSAAHTNELIRETSPYLLQHAHNPVNWHPWKEAVLQKARDENKLLLISIGYSACHWCHVMERECFEDEETARLMNRHFINIKVDREERPDIDQVYMQAVQLITGSGGWPLNCIALPDGRPLFGGTYFPRERWKQALLQVAEFYRREPAKCLEYAAEITLAAGKSKPLIRVADEPKFKVSHADEIYHNWQTYFDRTEGGPNRAPKFPLPNNLLFLLRYGYHTNGKSCLDYVYLTLKKMAYGGIYDQLGGGFCRYSTDSFWKVPHFEKMLYDNAQLISIYARAYQLSGIQLFREVVTATIDFLEREMKHENGGFFAALDADSEGVEGRYYVWQREELESLLGERFALFAAYYNINENGLWEHGNYILLRKNQDEEVFSAFGLTDENGRRLLGECRKILMDVRSRRIRPGLDDKIIVSWNACMITAYVDTYHATGDESFLKKASELARFILETCSRPDGGLWHSWQKQEMRTNGFLDDYSFTIEALIELYSASSVAGFLTESQRLAAYAIQNFGRGDNGYFYYASSKDQALYFRNCEMEDNVIPSSNSSMAKALFRLGYYFPGSGYRTMAKQLLSGILERAVSYGSSYSNWGLLLLDHVYPFYELVITGHESRSMARRIQEIYLPNKLLSFSETESDLDQFKGRWNKDRTLAYVCENQVCFSPVDSVERVFDLLKLSGGQQ